jgi:hypothetical protein
LQKFEHFDLSVSQLLAFESTLLHLREFYNGRDRMGNETPLRGDREITCG